MVTPPTCCGCSCCCSCSCSYSCRCCCITSCCCWALPSCCCSIPSCCCPLVITSREPAAASCRPAGTRHDFLLSATCSLLLHLPLLLLVCLLVLLFLLLLPILLVLLLLLQLLQQPRKSRPARLSPAGHYRAAGHVYRVMWPSVMCSPRSAELSALLSHSSHRNCRLTQYSCTVPRSALGFSSWI